jgi:hypothetical protein
MKTFFYMLCLHESNKILKYQRTADEESIQYNEERPEAGSEENVRGPTRR